MKKIRKFKRLIGVAIILVVAFSLASCSTMNNLNIGGNNDDSVYISTVEELITQIDAGTYKLKLSNDIDLNGVDWKPINFSGFLDGNGYKIKNLTISDDGFSTENVGLFCVLDGRVSNLTLENVNITVSGKRAKNVGGLCGTMTNPVSTNVSVTGHISAPSAENVGGVCGLGDFISGDRDVVNIQTLTNAVNVSGNTNVGGVFGSLLCTPPDNYHVREFSLKQLSNNGNIIGQGDYVGGICGRMYASKYPSYALLQADQQINTGDVSGNAFVGGLFGSVEVGNTESYIRDGVSSGKITSTGGIAGGIAGKVDSVKIESCDNSNTAFDVSGYFRDNTEKKVYIGGYVGISGGDIEDCKNSADISYDDEGTGGIGGICGMAVRDPDSKTQAQYKDLENDGDIEGNTNVGGILGVIESDNIDNYHIRKFVLLNLQNNGNIIGQGDYVGGICGRVYASEYPSCTLLQADQQINTGDVSGNAFVGGLFGSVEVSNAESYIRDGVSSGKITSTGGIAGGIAGKVDSVKIESCDNSNTAFDVSGYFWDNTEKKVYVGGYVGISNGDIEDCKNSADISYDDEGTGGIGGICGIVARDPDINTQAQYKDLENDGDIEGNTNVGGIFGVIKSYNTDNYHIRKFVLLNLQNSGNITGQEDYVGGICGRVYASEYPSCTLLQADQQINTGDVSGNAFVGGLFGSVEVGNTESYIRDGVSSGKITSTGGIAGGIAGKVDSVKIESCDNSNTAFDVSGTTSLGDHMVTILGGYVGISGGSFSELSNNSDVECNGISLVGGICGYIDATNNISFVNVVNEKNVSGDVAGGLVGMCESTAKVELRQLENNGDVNSTGKTAGGFFGSMVCKTLVGIELENNADVIASNYAGAVFGVASYGTSGTEVTDYSNNGSLSASQIGELYAYFYEKQTSLLERLINLFN